jgi:chemotaxis protein MotB
MAANKRSANEPEPRPIIVKKIIVEGHGGHHGGAWKVAYADFVTAMMAFFLLMWLLGATTEKQRKALADYFTPTLVDMKSASAGATGMFGGDSMTGKENYPTTGGQGNLAITIPRDATGTKDDGGKDMKSRDQETFKKVKKYIESKMETNKALKQFMKNVRFTETREGLRIDLIDQADFAMFAMATDTLLPQARSLLGEVAKVIGSVPNDVIVRGHTDGLPYAAGRTMNNWMLSSARAEATRKALADFGVGNNRFAKIEGVADRDPYVTSDVYDPRNRRMSIILGWSGSGSNGSSPREIAKINEKSAKTDAVAAAIRFRDDPARKLRAEVTALDMGGTALPPGAVPINHIPGKKSEKGVPKPGKH